MTPPNIQALGVTQEGAVTRWKATGYVEGVGWLGGAWGTSLITALEALKALACQADGRGLRGGGLIDDTGRCAQTWPDPTGQ